MSIVADQIRKVDCQIDRVHLVPSSTREGIATSQVPKVISSTRIAELQSLVKALSATSSSQPLLSSWRIRTLLEQAALPEQISVLNEEEDEGGREEEDEEHDEDDDDDEVRFTREYERELEWLLVSKATVQTYGLLLNTLLEQTIPLNDDIWYWDEVLGSYAYTGLYTIQTSPLRFWAWSKDIYYDTRNRVAKLREAPNDTLSAKDIGSSLTGQWRQFYGLVRESIQERSVADIQRRVLSPIALCRTEARHKQAKLRRLREMSASGLGVLMDEGLAFDIDDESSESVKGEGNESHEWKGVVERSVALMDTVLCNVTALETSVSDFEDVVFATVEDDPDVFSRGSDASAGARPAKVARRLEHILSVHVPNHISNTQLLAAEYGRPSKLVRYWLPATALLLSSTTILRIFVNRKAEIVAWIRDIGVTCRDFWMNWVVDPTKKIIGTIRHDKDSEVAIMSKESLKGDRDSLERMVVDFAIDSPESAGLGNGELSEAQISDVRRKVKEGDLTPVLRAYEKDLRQPFVGTVRGDLVRTLLIQIQKTKVDVEVAISGIDALLKSQELVFGFVGLTPGILVCVASFRYLGSAFGQRKGSRQHRRAGQTIRVLRNIDRILTLATPTQNNILSYKDHGLLLCEVHVLRKRAHSLFPGEIEREFLEDVGDLCNINSGIQTQLTVLQRIRWGYAKWLK
ncbi:ATP synthase regulation protein NCA2 [Phlyctema vagabunda]|uniref:ATP synthase regulation protein NCA2 n=1 Tax=Phlyctema vagabunda TaxID=108571 RepID=A0ABR4PUI8_9HELO